MNACRRGVKREKKKERTAILSPITMPAKRPGIETTTVPISLRVALTAPKRLAAAKSVVRRSPSVSRIISSTHAEQLVKQMNLDEMLEASKAVELGIIGCGLPKIESPNAQKYATVVLGLTKKRKTKPKAEKMRQDLNKQIIKVNRQTTDAIESKRLYHELMAED